MNRVQLESRLLTFAQWCVWLVPVACAVSRFASDLLLSVTAATFLVHAVLTRRTDWLQIRWVQVALLLWIYTILLSFGASDMEKAFGRSLSWIRFPIFAVALIYWVLEEARARKWLILSLSGAVGFMLIDTALQYFTGHDIFGWSSIPGEGSPRLTGPFSAPRVGIMVVWMAVPAIAYWLMNEGGGARRGKMLVAGICFAIGLLTVVFMSGERMALMLTGLSFIAAFFLLPISKRLMLAIGSAALCIMVTLAYFNPGLVARQVHSTEKVVDDFSGSDYGKIWQSAWNIIEANPIFGVGLRQFRVVCPDPAYGSTDAAELASRCNLHPHNMYLEWLVESGAVGLGLFLFMTVLICRHAWQHFPYHRTDPIFLGLVINLLIRLWPLASTTSYFTAWSAVPMWLVIGWLLAICRNAGPTKH